MEEISGNDFWPQHTSFTITSTLLIEKVKVEIILMGQQRTISWSLNVCVFVCFFVCIVSYPGKNI